MALIKISNLNADLSASDSFLTELQETETKQIVGGTYCSYGYGEKEGKEKEKEGKGKKGYGYYNSCGCYGYGYDD